MTQTQRSATPTRPARPQRPQRRRASVTAVMLGLLCGAVAVGAYGAASPDGSTPLATPPKDTIQPVVAFTDAGSGSCVTWVPGPDGVNSDFSTVDCAQPHRFEVSAREDLATYPTSEFGPDAPQPNRQRQQQLTDELCVGPTMTYLDGKLDPEGRYTITPILPPPSSWAEGDRTMLCGVMVQDESGRSVETTGLAARTDQARYSDVGACVRVDGAAAREVPCSEDHTWQVTKVVNLAEPFPGGWPDINLQNQHLNGVCTAAAQDFLGGDDPLYYSTLTPFWTTIQPQSWQAGSRTVNCALVFGHKGGGFGVLKGDAKSGFTIDGAPPAEQPKRNPLRTPAQ